MPYLYSSPTLLTGECHSWCSKHLSGTRDLFSSPNYSPSGQEMNSVSLFSCSNHLLLSPSSSPLLLVEQPASSSDSNRNEPDAPSVINPSNLKTSFSKMIYRASVCMQHSTIQTILLNVSMHRLCTPAGVSPLLSGSRGPTILVTNLFSPPQWWFGFAVILVLQNTLGSTLGKERGTLK